LEDIGVDGRVVDFKEMGWKGVDRLHLAQDSAYFNKHDDGKADLKGACGVLDQMRRLAVVNRVSLIRGGEGGKEEEEEAEDDGNKCLNLLLIGFDFFISNQQSELQCIQ
jgi:hypothetical protein